MPDDRREEHGSNRRCPIWRKTGKTYTVPVSYHREDDAVTLVTKRMRKWWHNFETPAQVTVRLAGRDYTGEAQIMSGEEQVLELMLDYLHERPIDAKAYGVGKEVTEEKVKRIVPQIVVIQVHLSSEAS